MQKTPKILVSEIIIISCCCFLIGVATSELLTPDNFSLILPATLSLIAFLTRKNIKIFCVFLFLSFFVLGIWRHSLITADFTKQGAEIFAGKQSNIAGQIASTQTTAKSARFLINIQNINNAHVNGNLLVSAPRHYAQTIHYGDQISLNCVIESARDLDNQGYGEYLILNHIGTLCYARNITVLNHADAKNWGNALVDIKTTVSDYLQKGLAKKESALALAMFLGDKSMITSDDKALFSQAGLSHIIAISGLHIGILSGLVLFVFLHTGMRRVQAAIACAIVIIAYTILVGAPASAIRATMMGILILTALAIGRVSKILNILAIAAFVMVFANPLILFRDIGFQLSFLAISGIVIFYRPIRAIIKNRVKNKIGRWALGTMSVSVAAQIFVWPIIVLNFQILSLIFPITNLIVLWALPILMITTIIGIILTMIVPGLELLFFYPSGIILNFIIKTAEILGAPHWAWIEINNLLPLVIAGYYIILLLALIWLYLKNRLSTSHSSA